MTDIDKTKERMKERRIIRYKGAVLKMASNKWNGMEWLVIMKGWPRIHDPTDTHPHVKNMKWWFEYAKEEVDRILEWEKSKTLPKNWINHFQIYKKDKAYRKPRFRINNISFSLPLPERTS